MSSDGITVDASDLNRIVQVIGVQKENKRYRVQRILQASADKILQQAQDEVPLDSGALSDSGHVSPHVEDANTIAFDVIFGDGNGTGTIYDYGDTKLADGYAWFVELGTTKMPARPYLGPAFEEESQNIVYKLGQMFTDDTTP